MAKSAPELNPLKLIEDAETGDRFILYSKPEGIELELRFEGEEPWATQDQMSNIFAVERSVITKHIGNVFRDGEIAEQGNVQKLHISSTKPTKVYGLDVILAIGYRVSSTQGIMFRRWANDKLRQYLLKGFVIDKPRLKDPKRNDHLDELLEEIADIRASEAHVWKRILELISKCSDYHLMTKKDQSNYFATFQNAMHWAVAQSTAAELIWHRVDATKPFAGLEIFDGIEEGKQPKTTDGTIAKNFYGKDELDRLRMITNLALDFLASQAEQGRLVTVAQYTDKLRELLKLDGRPVIQKGHKGEVTKKVADEKSAIEIGVYKERIRLEKEVAGERAVGNLLSEARQIAQTKREKRQVAAKPGCGKEEKT